MAQRLATEYVKTCLQLNDLQLNQFVALFHEIGPNVEVKVLENGSQEVVFKEEAAGEAFTLSFERVAGSYVCTGSCRFTNLHMANAMRKALAEFKGSATVRRIFTGFVMVYEYANGSVVRIVEIKDGEEHIVFTYRDTASELQRLFESKAVELEIGAIHAQINQLLDLRNSVHESEVQRLIDERLQQMTKRLFVLEA